MMVTQYDTAFDGKTLSLTLAEHLSISYDSVSVSIDDKVLWAESGKERVGWFRRAVKPVDRYLNDKADREREAFESEATAAALRALKNPA